MEGRNCPFLSFWGVAATVAAALVLRAPELCAQTLIWLGTLGEAYDISADGSSCRGMG